MILLGSDDCGEANACLDSFSPFPDDVGGGSVRGQLPHLGSRVCANPFHRYLSTYVFFWMREGGVDVDLQMCFLVFVSGFSHTLLSSSVGVEVVTSQSQQPLIPHSVMNEPIQNAAVDVKPKTEYQSPQLSLSPILGKTYISNVQHIPPNLSPSKHY